MMINMQENIKGSDFNYNHSEKGRARRRKYNRSEAGRLQCEKYNSSEKGKRRAARYRDSHTQITNEKIWKLILSGYN